ncbi:hypothetical protein D3W54_15095 [Komagataeibacter medellinensis]|uniref:Uncharacterized protein n=1 Tax=Komagataeibacter medellinensis TaxID=1177712 RepID=A0ABQ6VRD2_9PROT|nr:hypothetical protein D3W54_15095 [Komagataeibacter medellinensis]
MPDTNQHPALTFVMGEHQLVSIVRRYLPGHESISRSASGTGRTARRWCHARCAFVAVAGIGQPCPNRFARRRSVRVLACMGFTSAIGFDACTLYVLDVATMGQRRARHGPAGRAHHARHNAIAACTVFAYISAILAQPAPESGHARTRWPPAGGCLQPQAGR